MTLRTKTTLIVSSSFLALVSLLAAAAIIVVLGRFRVLETDEAWRNAERAGDALNDQIATLSASTTDWAHWDDAAAFITGRMPTFIGSNLMADTFTTLRLDLIAFIGRDGRVVYARWFDRTAGRFTEPLAGFDEALAPGQPLVTHADVRSHREGLLAVSGSFLLVSSQPLTNSLGSPPSLGTLVFGRILDGAEMERLSGIVQLDCRLSVPADAALTPAQRKALESPPADSRGLVATRGPDRIASIVPLKDIGGKTAAFLEVEAPRPIYREALLSIPYLAGSLIVCCLMTGILLFVLLSRLVLSPLSALSENVRRIGAGGGEARIPIRGNDELAGVSASINGMLDALNLSEAQRGQLEERLSHVHRLESIGTLAGGVAHDFNNILMAILGLCDLLESGRDRGTEVGEIRKAALRAASLTSQLLAFSRQQRLQFQAVDLNTLLADMAGMLQRLLGEHLALELALQPGLAAVWADPGQVQQVIMNLAVNARDAMPDGGTLTITTRNLSADIATAGRLGLRMDRYVACSVSDTGVGMDEGVRARIFEPFFTTKELGRGTGLGLAVVWGIMKQSGGVIDVQSSTGRGTTFDMYFPATDEPVRAAASLSPAASSSTGAETVLVAEDDKAIRSYLVTSLKKAGFTVVEAADGEEALHRAEEHGGNAIQLLLSDVVMPRTGGALLAQRLRKKYPSMRVLFMSGNADLMAGGTALPDETPIIQKPFDTPQLIQAVREALRDP